MTDDVLFLSGEQVTITRPSRFDGSVVFACVSRLSAGSGPLTGRPPVRRAGGDRRLPGHGPHTEYGTGGARGVVRARVHGEGEHR
ncbi:hypothetical protein [Streptomyces sp. NPDC005760]|uniref:hypothetical protein n=1 Tax=Streptomyces sp. NPDC005760 TaxID=3156718 RepID=UPI0033F0F3C3